MTATTVTCIVIACDICGDELDQERDEGIRHFGTIAEAVKAEQDEDPEYAWIIRAGGYAICPADDDEHRRERGGWTRLDAPPPEPQIPGQTELAVQEAGDHG